MPDIFSYDIVEAFGRSGCPLCRVDAIDELRWITSFWREGRHDAGARRRFYAGGGFCRRHAWLLHRVVAAEGAGAAIADVYGSLAGYDLAWLDELRQSLDRGRRRRPRSPLRRRRRCSACAAIDDGAERKIYFFVQAVAEPKVRAHYASSNGLCFPHLTAAVEHAFEADEEVAGFLLDDWRDRLAHVRAQLADFDRKRDYRYASEPKGEEQSSWTDVIRRYVGEDLIASEDEPDR